MIELHHLTHFLAVLESGNFSAAARVLNISQPALTKSIHRMEELLGTPLFDRTPRPVPTRFGRLLSRHARTILAGVGDLTQEVMLFQGLAGGHVSVGAGPMMADVLMGPALGRLITQHPKLNVMVHIDNFSRFPAMLKAREIDFFIADITGLNRDPDLTVFTLPQHPVIWFCRTGHPLAKKRTLRMVEMMQYPMIAPELPTWAMEQLSRFSSQPTRSFRPSVVCSHYSTIKHIVASSDGFSGTINTNILADEEGDRFVRLRPTDAPMKSNPGIVVLKDRVLSPAAHALMEEIKRGGNIGGGTDQRNKRATGPGMNVTRASAHKR
jgi:DNA-binding transcriptional LysR family regulator